MIEIYKNLMRKAISEAVKAGAKGEIPVGAIIVTQNGDTIAKAHNRVIESNDPTAHAEILVIREAGKRLGNYRLNGMTMVSTIEPCIMCAGAMVHSRIKRCIFGASDPKWGGTGSLFQIANDNRLNHRIEIISGILEQECRELLREFFKNKR